MQACQEQIHTTCTEDAQQTSHTMQPSVRTNTSGTVTQRTRSSIIVATCAVISQQYGLAIASCYNFFCLVSKACVQIACMRLFVLSSGCRHAKMPGLRALTEPAIECYGCRLSIWLAAAFPAGRILISLLQMMRRPSNANELESAAVAMIVQHALCSFCSDEGVQAGLVGKQDECISQGVARHAMLPDAATGR